MPSDRLTAFALLIFSPAALQMSQAPPALGQTPGDPFPDPIEAEEGVIEVDVVEFASIPDADGEPARMMTLVHEPGTDRIFVSDQRGSLYTVSDDGRTVIEYLDVDAPEWGVGVQSSGRERGVQSFAFHPQYAEPGSPGFGRLYVWTDVQDTSATPDFVPSGGNASHHTVLLEWTAENPGSERYDGGPPRELARFEQPFGNHNGGEIAFNPLASDGDADFGLLYVGNGDGGAGGDPFDMAQNLSSAFGKILRIDPLGSDGATGEYGLPADNPFVSQGEGAGAGSSETLGEIWALGVRNPQHLAWDPTTGALFVADIGQNTVEEVSIATPGADLGWNDWEGSFRFAGREGVSLETPRSDPDVTYPIAEYDHSDPILGGRAAVTGLVVVRDETIPQLANRVVFGDLPSGELFHLNADDVSDGGDGGQEAIRRILLRRDGEATTLLQLIREKNQGQGREPARRADLRLGADRDGRIFLLNKHDGTLRLLVPGAG